MKNVYNFLAFNPTKESKILESKKSKLLLRRNKLINLYEKEKNDLENELNRKNNNSFTFNIDKTLEMPKRKSEIEFPNNNLAQRNKTPLEKEIRQRNFTPNPVSQIFPSPIQHEMPYYYSNLNRNYEPLIKQEFQNLTQKREKLNSFLNNEITNFSNKLILLTNHEEQRRKELQDQLLSNITNKLKLLEDDIFSNYNRINNVKQWEETRRRGKSPLNNS